MQNNALNIVAADDDEVVLELLVHSLKKAGHNTVGFNESEKLVSYLKHQQEEPDVIILDKLMPDLSGLDILKHIKKDPRLQDIPVIIQSGDIGLEYLQESVDAGAYYYLTKPYDQDTMVSLVKAAARDSLNRKLIRDDLKLGVQHFQFLKQAVFKIQNPTDGLRIAALIASMAKRTQEVSLVLSELITNAIEHGNLGIGYQRKAQLLEVGQLDNEIEHLLNLEENKKKFLHVYFARSANKIKVRVTDEGEGFDWKNYLHINPDRFVDLNGRGIAYAKIVGIDLHYSDEGRVVEFACSR